MGLDSEPGSPEAPQAVQEYEMSDVGLEEGGGAGAAAKEASKIVGAGVPLPPPAGTDGAPLPPIPVSQIPKPYLGPDPEYDPANLPPQAPYYWQEKEGEGGAAPHPWWNKAWHNVHYYGVKLVEVGEAIGGGVAGVLGLTDSQFQYVIDSLEHEEWQRQQQAEAEGPAPDSE